MFVRFRKPFPVKDTRHGKITYPRGWAGEIDEATFAAAKAANALVPLPDPVFPATAEAAEGVKLLEDAEQSVVAAQAKLDAATSDAEKKAAQKSLDEAKAALAKLKG